MVNYTQYDNGDHGDYDCLGQWDAEIKQWLAMGDMDWPTWCEAKKRLTPAQVGDLTTADLAQVCLACELIKSATHIVGGWKDISVWAMLSWQIGHNPMPHLRDITAHNGRLPDWRFVRVACEFMAQHETP